MQAPERSFVESCGELVDEMRQLYTDYGLRPYRVFAVVVRWTGGASGAGTAAVVGEAEFLPTPKLVDTRSVRTQAQSGGAINQGKVELLQLSPRYTEDEIRLLTFCGMSLPKGHDGFIEVRLDDRDGNAERRRFVAKAAPYRDAKGLQWKVELSSQQGDRSRDGRLTEDVTP